MATSSSRCRLQWRPAALPKARSARRGHGVSVSMPVASILASWSKLSSLYLVAANQYKIETGTAALKRLEAQDEKMMEKDADCGS